MNHIANRYKLTAIAAALSAGIASTSANAAAASSGSPFIVAGNDPTVQEGFPGGPYPVVARSESGDFVMVYSVSFASDPNVDHVYARLYNANGTPKGDAFEVGKNLYQIGSVAMAPSGAFVIAWDDAPTLNSTTGIYRAGHVRVQRYNADGTVAGSLMDLGPAPDGSLYGFRTQSISTLPHVAMDHDGNFAVAWTSGGYTGFDRNGYFFLKFWEWTKTYAAVYSPGGRVLKAKTVVDNVPGKVIPGDGDHYNGDFLKDLAMDADGDLVMTFDVGRDTTVQTGVKLLDPKLHGKGSLSSIPDVKRYTALGIDANGNFAIEWTDPTDSSLHVSRYASDASLLGNIGPIETPTTHFASTEIPTLSMAPSGDFVVTWGVTTPQMDFFGSGGFVDDSYNKYGQYFHADGTPNGGAFVINADPNALINWNMATAVDASGNLVSVWNTYIKNNDGTVSYVIAGALTTVP